MRSLLFAAALSLSAAPVFAQDLRELAKTYSELPAVQEMMLSMFSPEASATQVKSTLPAHVQLSDEKLLEVGTIMSEVLIGLKPDLEALQIEAIADLFTAEEIEAMIAFHSTEIGASIMKKTQPMFAKVLAELAPKIQAKMAERQQEIIKIMSQ